MMLLPLLLLWLREPLFFPRPLRYSLLLMFCLVAGHLPTAAEPDLPAPSSYPDAIAADTSGTTGAIQPAVAGADPPTQAGRRDREGSLVRNVRGQFTEVGRRWAFTSEDGRTSYKVLENLALQRVVKAVRQDADDNRWAVHGMLTEFGDDNYLLLRAVTRAVQAEKP